jgi:hypothetical protein
MVLQKSCRLLADGAQRVQNSEPGMVLPITHHLLADGIQKGKNSKQGLFCQINIPLTS